MPNPIRAVIIAATAIATALVFAPASPEVGASSSRHRRPPSHQAYGLEGVKLYHDLTVAWYAKATADDAARAAWAAAIAEAARVKAAQRSTQPRGRSAPLGGPCAASKPEGFPDSIIWRESRGDPNAVNSNGGASGCAQIMPFWFAPGGGCYGLAYDECWARMWNGGKGASNWACTPESGCRG